MSTPPAIQRFVAAAEAVGLSPEIREFRQGTKTAADAARAIGCEVGKIVKSLVFMAGAEPFLALTGRTGPTRRSCPR